MAKLLPIVTEPNQLLYCKSKTVEAVDCSIRELMDDMLLTMKENSGIGLAAVQVGVLKKIVVIQLPEDKAVLYMVNPEITFFSEESNIYQEGCLSFPTARADVTRPDNIRVKFLDYNGKQQERFADGILATCIQHEVDHTNGIVFTKHLSRLKGQMIRQKVKKYLDKNITKAF